MTIKELQEKRGEALAKIKALRAAAEGREFTSDEQKQWDEASADFDAATRDLERRKTEREIEDRAGQTYEEIGREDYEAKKRGEATEEDRATAMQAWFRSRAGMPLDRRHNEAVERSRLNVNSGALDIPLFSRAPKSEAEVRAQSVGTDSEGGYTVPTGFVAELEKALLVFGGVREVARVIRTASGNDLHWPTVNDTSNKGVLLAEGTEETTVTDLTFSELVLNAYKYSSDIVRISTELLEDSAFNMVSEIGAALGERLARILAEHNTTGTGSSQPNGVVTASTAGTATASNAAVTADELITFFHEVEPAYRGMGTWMFNDSTLAVIRKLKGSDNNYLWQPGLQSGAADMLLGRPYVVNQDMADIGTTAKSILFGDFSKYILRDVGNLRLRRDDRPNFDQDGYIAFMRHDSDLLNAGTAPIKHLPQPV